MKKIVVIGGGTGLSSMLKGMKRLEDVDLTAIVTVADDGGSTGRIRDIYNIPAVGDIRHVLCAMADEEDEGFFSDLLNYRFEGMEVCESCEVHENLLKIVNEKMPEETELYDLAELFKVFGDSTRMRILFVLFEAEVCVCDLAEALNMTQSAISHQLRILKQNKLVKSRREGKSVFYSLADDHVRTIVDQGREHIEEDL